MRSLEIAQWDVVFVLIGSFLAKDWRKTRASARSVSFAMATAIKTVILLFVVYYYVVT